MASQNFQSLIVGISPYLLFVISSQFNPDILKPRFRKLNLKNMPHIALGLQNDFSKTFSFSTTILCALP
jgi:hypothetical protein